MEDHSILNFPEIREMILRNLETKDLNETVLVCPAFYKIVCEIERNKTLDLNGKVNI